MKDLRARVETTLKRLALATLPQPLLYALWHLWRRRQPRVEDGTASDRRVVPVQDGAHLDVYWSDVHLGSGPSASLYVLDEEVLRLDCFGGDRAHMHVNPIQANLPLAWDTTPRYYFPAGEVQTQIERGAFELEKNTLAALQTNQLARVRNFAMDPEKLAAAAARMSSEMTDLVEKHRGRPDGADEMSAADEGTPIRVGVIGCGRVAQQRHLPILRDLEGVELTAICDVDATTRSKLSEEYRTDGSFEDFRDLVASDAVDAVAITAPTQHHAEAGVAALEADKHVLIEKPLALSLDEVDRLTQAADRSGRIVAVAMNSRWHRLSRAARDTIREGSLGPIGLLRSAFTDDFRLHGDARPWMMQHELGGCVLVEQAVHHFDLWQFLLDSRVEEIDARMQDPMEIGERATVSATMSNGVIVSGIFSEGLKAVNELEIFGQEGQIRLSMYDFDGLDFTPTSEYPGTMGPRIRRLRQAVREFPGAFRRRKSGGDWVGSYRSEWEHFRDCIRTGTAPECGLEQGRNALQVGLAAMGSLAQGRSVRIADAPREILPFKG